MHFFTHNDGLVTCIFAMMFCRVPVNFLSRAVAFIRTSRLHADRNIWPVDVATTILLYNTRPRKTAFKQTALKCSMVK